MDRIPALHRRIKQLEKTRLQTGVIESFTIVRHPPAGFGSEPYAVALVRLQDGTKVMAQLTKESPPPFVGAAVVPHMRRVRTMENGLLVNDIKYAVAETKTTPLFAVTSYVLAVSGPSGVGKTTITRQLMTLFASYAEQVPIVTTRQAKKTDTEPYVHVSKEEFDRLIETKEIVSWTHMPSTSELRYYGYRRKDIEAIWKKGKLPIVVTEINLLQGLVQSLGRRAVLSCGLLPPGKSKRLMLSSLLHRLRSRGRETEDQIAERLKIAEADLKAFTDHAHLFDHMLVNDEVGKCVQTIQELVTSSS